MSNLNLRKALASGLAGTAAMTMLMIAAPMMGMPPMNIGKMLGSVMGGSLTLGWAAHFMIGTVLAIAYAAIFAARLPGGPALRGAAFSVLPWLLAQLVVMPMMGAGVFSGSALMAMGSLLGHLAYGAVVGAVYGAPAASPGSTDVHRPLSA
jgi:hypothetical protein